MLRHVLITCAALAMSAPALADSKDKLMCRTVQICSDELAPPAKSEAPPSKAGVPTTKVAVSRLPHDQIFLEWEGSPPANPQGVGMHHLTCQPRDGHVCCYAEMTDHEWKHCKDKSWSFATKGNVWFTASRKAQVYVICLPKGHANVGYKTSTGRHLIAHFD